MSEDISRASSTPSTNDLITQVREAMTVVTATGQELGTVEYVRLGTSTTATTPGGDLQDSEPNVPEPFRSELLRSGFIKVTGPDLLELYRYLRSDHIAAVNTDTVRLSMPSADAVQLWTELQSRYVDTQVSEGGAEVNVAFADRSGQSYQYSFGRAEAEPSPAGPFQPQYHTTWTGWELNRKETIELARDGANASVIYAIAAAAGCGPCVLGAVVEQHWATQANNYYNRGHCAKIYYWLGITEHSGKNCK